MFNALIGEGGFGLVLSGLFIRNKVRKIMSSSFFLHLTYLLYLHHKQGMVCGQGDQQV